MTEKLSNPTQILGALGDFGPSEYQPKHRRELVFENEVEFEELPELNPTRARHMGARALRNYIPTFASETFSPKHRAELKHKAERGVTIEQTTEDHSIESEHALITDDKEILGQSRHLRREPRKTSRNTEVEVPRGFAMRYKIRKGLMKAAGLVNKTSYAKQRFTTGDAKMSLLEGRLAKVQTKAEDLNARSEARWSALLSNMDSIRADKFKNKADKIRAKIDKKTTQRESLASSYKQKSDIHEERLEKWLKYRNDKKVREAILRDISKGYTLYGRNHALVIYRKMQDKQDTALEVITQRVLRRVGSRA